MEGKQSRVATHGQRVSVTVARRSETVHVAPDADRSRGRPRLFTRPPRPSLCVAGPAGERRGGPRGPRGGEPTVRRPGGRRGPWGTGGSRPGGRRGPWEAGGGLSASAELLSVAVEAEPTDPLTRS